MKKFLRVLAILFAFTPVFAAENYGITGHKTTENTFTGICDSAINKLNNKQTVTEFSCDKDIYKTFRFGSGGMIFQDDFSANGHDRWLWRYCGLIIEQDDYNTSGNPEIISIDWNRPRIRDTMHRKIPANQHGIILQSTGNGNGVYRIKQHPAFGKRDKSNILVKYAVVYSNDEQGNDMYYHTECAHYEITWCGDGTVDEEYGEKCDPGKEGTKDLGNGKICNSNCEIVDKTAACSSKYKNKKVYTNNSTPYITKDTPDLCEIGNLTPNTFNRFGTPIKYEWGCANGTQKTSSNECKFQQYRCGDGEINGGGDWSDFINGAHYEQCDPEASEWKNRTDGQKCNSSCNIEYTASCGRLDRDDAKYNSNYPSQRITENSAGLCDMGQVKAGSFKYDKETGKYTWDCENGNSTDKCDAQDLWCGDGEKNGTEQCDYKDTDKKEGWGGKWETCNDKCVREPIPQEGPVCNSSISGHTEYTTYSSDWLNRNSGLCTRGQVTYFNSEWSTGSQRKFTWKCNNDDLDITCTAKQEWCGDGKKNGGEKCDPNDTSKKEGWGDAGCSSTCDSPIYKQGICGSSYNEKTKYQDIKNPWITKNTQGLCDKGVVTGFSMNTGATRTFKWQCDNNGNISDQCKAKQEWCGDGVKNGNESCDGGDSCDPSCKIRNNECDYIETGNKLRLNKYYVFDDDFSPNGMTRYLYDFDVNFKENHGDYDNNPTKPTFSWTTELLNAGKKVDGGIQKMTVVTSPYDPKYHVISIPNKRARDNLLIEYTIRYDNQYHSTTPSRSSLYSHKECAYYEVTRCGDGILDEDYGEKCDPGSEGTKVLPDGRICNADCTISAPKGKLVPLKTLIGSKEIKSTGDIVRWSLRVTASGGDVGNFTMRDVLPPVLGYRDYKITHTGGMQISKPVTGTTKNNLGETVETVKWDVKGTLKKDDYVEIELVTYAKVMPEKDYDNVLCVRPENKENEEKCVEVPIPPVTPTAGKLDPVKTLIGSKEIKKVGDVVEWSLKVTAKGGDVTDFVMEDELPRVLGYTGYEVVHTPSKVEVKKPTTRTEKVGGKDVEIVQWKVKGTLYSGEYVELKVRTYAKVMPEKEYDNVLCVRPENIENDKKCVKKPIEPTAGKLVPLKTLIGSKEIKSTGDKVEWSLKVTAKGGDVTDFVMEDELPRVLGYSEYEVTHTPSKVTVQKPTTGTIKTGGKEAETVQWKVNGTLHDGDYVEIKLITYAKVMPDKDYNNVLCVREDNPEDKDCVPAEITPSKGKLEVIKTLVSNNKYVTSIDQELVWDITVKAKKGDVEMKYIKDKLPKELNYKTFEKKNVPSNITIVDKPELSDNGKTITWKTTGTLQSGNYIKLRLYTTVAEMPNKEIENVACAAGPQEECGTGYTSDLWIKKTVWNPHENKWAKSMTGNSGDTITYKIEFGNNGSTGVYVSLKDFLPKDIQVTDSSLYVKNGVAANSHEVYIGGEDTEPYTGSWDKVESVYINHYKSVYLKSKGSGVMTITGTALKSESDLHNRTNFACIYEGDNKVACDDAVYNVEDLTCKAPIISKKKLPGGGSTQVTCKTSGGKANIEICCDNSCNQKITSKGKVSSLTGTCTYSWKKDSDSKDYPVSCVVNGKTDHSCEDHITVGPSELQCKKPDIKKSSFSYKGGSTEVTCKTSGGNANIKIDCGNGDVFTKSNVDSYTATCEYPKNTGSKKEEYEVACEINGVDDDKCKDTVTVGTSSSSCFIAGTKVTMADGSEKNIEDVKIGEKVLGSNGTINTVLGYDRPVLGNRHLWSINGSEYFVSDEHPFMTTEGWKSFNPEMTKLEVNLNTTELKVGDILVTVKGQEEVKTVDYIDADFDTPLYNFILGGDHTYYANGYLVHNKGKKTDYCEEYPDDAVCYFASPNCFNINEGNVSIETTEYLPIYMNIEKDEDAKDYGYKYKVYKGRDFDDFDSDSDCDPGTVALNSMECEYVIKQNNKEVFIATDKCLEKTFMDNVDLVKARAKRQNDSYTDYEIMQTFNDGNNYTYAATVKTVKPSDDWTEPYNLGEYAFQIRNVKYRQCMPVGEDGETGRWEEKTSDGIICQSNFVVTEPYTVQKTPSGNLTASTDTLEKFKRIDNGQVVPFSKLLDAISTTTYTPNAKVKDAMDSFINKYKKLAVEVKGNNVSKFDNNSDAIIKKVPGKDIYFVEGDITVKGGSTISKPFTLVQTNGNTIISGNVNHNMMLLTKGNITFKGNCTSDQNVKGIFYTEKMLNRTGVLHNDRLEHDVWCYKGGLNIKGVLIGDNFDNLMKNSRSHLETWFDETNGKGGKNAKTIMNGASVVIEYSPSIFTKSTMPPGAEDFTTALSIYRQ